MLNQLWRLRSVHLTTGIAGGLFVPYLSLLLVHDGMHSGQIGWITSIGTLASILIQPVWGMIVDRFQVSRLTLFVSTVIPAVIAWLYDAPWLTTLILVSLVATILATPQIPVVNAFSIVVARQANTTFGTIRMFGSLGFALGGYAGGWFLQHFAISALWLPYAALSLIGGVTALTLRPLKEVGVGVGGSIREGTVELLSNRRFVLFLIGGFLVSQTLTAFNTYFALAFQSIGGSIGVTGFAFMLASATNVPAMLISARVMRRLGRGNTMLLAAFAYTVRWSVQALVPIPWVAISIQALHGVCFGLFYVAAVDYVSDVARKDIQTTAQSVFNMVTGGLAGILGNLSNGYLLHWGGSVAMYGSCAISCALGTICLWFVAKPAAESPRRKPQVSGL